VTRDDPHRQEGQTHNRGVFDMKVVNIREARATLASLIRGSAERAGLPCKAGQTGRRSAGGGGE